MQDAQFWSKLAPRYARDPIKDETGYERSLAAIRPQLRGAEVLELGCGTGSTALRLAADAERYLATDIADGMIAIARQKLAKQPVTGLSFEVATAESVPQSTFDTILGLNYLHLVRDVPGTLARINRLLRPGGAFISKTACLSDMSFLLRGVVPLMQVFGKAPHVAFFTADDLHQAMVQAGFKLETVAYHASSGKDTRPFIVARKP